MNQLKLGFQELFGQYADFPPERTLHWGQRMKGYKDFMTEGTRGGLIYGRI